MFRQNIINGTVPTHPKKLENWIKCLFVFIDFCSVYSIKYHNIKLLLKSSYLHDFKVEISVQRWSVSQGALTPACLWLCDHLQLLPLC